MADKLRKFANRNKVEMRERSGIEVKRGRERGDTDIFSSVKKLKR